LGVCGICGFAGDPAGLKPGAMLEALAHRGPDGRGEFRRDTPYGRVWLGHTRLAILDLSPTGAQPMTTQDGVHTIVLNGEIYNYRTLREELKSRGYTFRGTSDTEVLLYLLREEGEAALDKVRGMFAFAFYDADTEELLLARDPYGIKPLYVVQGAGRLVFASEVRALLRGGDVEPSLDPEGLESYLAYGCVMQPRTIVRGIECLQAGALLRWRLSEGRARRRRYYAFPEEHPEQPRSYAEAVEAISAEFRRVVREHMVADVPVGVLLSGGIDSSGIVAVLGGQGMRVDTFSVVFVGEDAAMSEAPYSAAVAREFRANQHQVPASGPVAESVRAALAALDQPSIDGVNTFLVCQAVRRAGITVVQSGLGADEVFVGYGTHRTMGRLLAFGKLARMPFVADAAKLLAAVPFVQGRYPLGKLLGYVAAGGGLMEAYAAARGLFPPQLTGRLLGRPPASPALALANGTAKARDFAARVSLLELGNYMGNMLLRDSDAMSMAHGLELRVPYLDRDLVERVVTLPASFKLHHGRQKPLLVDAIRPPLPREVVERRKQGFTLPFARWLRSELREDMEATFGDARALATCGIEPTVARWVWERYVASCDVSAWTRPWAIHVLVRWWERVGSYHGRQRSAYG